MYPLAWGLRRLFLLYAYLLSLVGGDFHRGFPLLSQSLAAAIRHTVVAIRRVKITVPSLPNDTAMEELGDSLAKVIQLPRRFPLRMIVRCCAIGGLFTSIALVSCAL